LFSLVLFVLSDFRGFVIEFSSEHILLSHLFRYFSLKRKTLSKTNHPLKAAAPACIAPHRSDCPQRARSTPMWLNELWRRWFGRTRPFPAHLRRRQPGTGLRLEVLDDRTLLSAPIDATLGVNLPGQSEGGQVNGTYFLGGSFNNVGGSVGGTSSGFGAQASLYMSGKVGLDLGYSASSGGQVNVSYQGVNLQSSYVDPTQFGQEVNFTPQNTNVSYQGGAFSTAGPSVSVTAGLDSNISGTVSGSITAFGQSAGGSTNFSGGVNQQLLSIGLGSDTASNDLGLMVNVLGNDISSDVNQHFSQVALSGHVNPLGPEVPVYIQGDLIGTTDPIGLHEDLQVGAGEGEGNEAVGGSVQLGSMDEFAPDLSLSSNSLQGGGVLTASAQGNLADLNIQMAPVIAEMLSAAGFPVGSAALAFDTDTISLGPLSATITPASFQIGPDLSLVQTSTITPTNTLTYNFFDAKNNNAISVDVTKDGTDLGKVSSVSFTPGVDSIGINFTGMPITVKPTWDFGLNYTVELDLDLDAQGTLTIGTAYASLGPVSTPTVGPVTPPKVFDFAHYKAATIYDNTYSLYSTSGSLTPFTIGSNFTTSLVVNTTVDGDAPYQSGVPNTGNLRAAVNSADNSTSPATQTIHLGPGVYNLAISPNSSGVGSSGSLYVGELGTNTNAINLVIEGAGAGQTIIQASPNFGAGIFNVAAGSSLTLDGVTIEGGSASEGGGIFNAGTVAVNDSTITDNTATDGGGIFNESKLLIDDSTISSNKAVGGGGGGIFNAYGGSLQVSNSTITLNGTDTSGGGIYNDGESSLAVLDSTIFDNSASLGVGGGILTGDPGTLTVLNSTVYGNVASLGGGIALSQGATGKATILNSTISGNGSIGGEGGGLFSQNEYGSNASFLLENTIVAGNSVLTSGGSGPDVYGTLDGNSAYNLIGDGTGWSMNSNGSNGHNLIGEDPTLSPLGHFGGPTETAPPLPGSPVIDAGSSALAANAGLLTDQRGYGRDIGAGVDIGAAEYQYDLGLSGYLSAEAPPGTVQYVYTVTNNGPDKVAGATLTVPLPQGVVFGSQTHPAGWSETDPNASNDNTVTFTLPNTVNFYPGQSAVFTVTAQVQNTAVGANLTNTATVGPNTWDNNPQNNSVTLTITSEQEGQAFQQQPGLSFLSNANLFHFTDAPLVNTPTVSSSGGSLAAGTYYYTVTTTTATGESTPGKEVTATTTGATSTVTLNWNPVSGASGYKVYRGTSTGAEDTLIATITGESTVSFTDTGSEATTAASPPMAESFTASVSWGDNSSNTSSDGSGAVSVVADPHGGFDVIGSHTYAAAGSYTITVTVTGSDGTTYSQQVVQNFNNTVELFHFTDPNANVTAGDFTAYVGWGDNSGDTSNDGSGTVSVVADPTGGFDVLGSHAYAEEGKYGTTVVVVGLDGTEYSNGPQQNAAVNQPLANALLYHFTDAYVPVVNPPTVSNSGGSLAAGAYYYTVTSTTQTGESTASNEVSVTTTGSTSAVTMSWDPVAGATGYKVYRGTAPGAEDTLLATITKGSTVSFADTGSETTSPASPPTANIFKAAVSWGDNDSNTSSDGSGTVSVVADPSGGFDVLGSHAYATAGSYGIAVSVSGADGSQTDGGIAYNSGLTPQQSFSNALLSHFTDPNVPFVNMPTVGASSGASTTGSPLAAISHNRSRSAFGDAEKTA
jgi:hypothetical protein